MKGTLATASAEGRLIKDGPFPASATAERGQLHGPASLRERVKVRGFIPQPAGPLIAGAIRVQPAGRRGM